MLIPADGGRRGCPGRSAGGAAVRPALSWPAAGRSGPQKIRALPCGTPLRTGKEVWLTHLRNSVSKVAKWRWLCGLCRPRAGQNQALLRNPAGSPAQAIRWTETTSVGGGVLGRPESGGPGPSQPVGGRKCKTPLLAMEYAGNQKLGNTHCPKLAQRDQTESNQIQPQVNAQGGRLKSEEGTDHANIQ